MAANNPERVKQMTDDDIKQLVGQGVEEALTRLGIDVSQPFEVQKDFQHLREWRVATQSLQKRGLIVILSIIIAGAAAAFWLGMKGLLSNP